MSIRHRIKLKDLDVFIAVTEGGSFRTAAKAMAVEPSAVSRRIRHLEDRLGASLFERTRTGVRLTDAGHLFHQQAGAIIERFDDASRLIHLAGHAGNGKVELGVIGSLSSRYLSQIIKVFRTTHPSVTLTVREGSTHDHLAAIADRSLDLAFLLGTPRPEGLEAQRLWSETVVAALAADDIRTAQASLVL